MQQLRDTSDIQIMSHRATERTILPFRAFLSHGCYPQIDGFCGKKIPDPRIPRPSQASIMDGFAVRASDGPGSYPLDAEQFAGEQRGPLKPGLRATDLGRSHGFFAGRRCVRGDFIFQKPSRNHVFFGGIFHLSVSCKLLE